MLDTLKDRLAGETEENHRLIGETERLQKDLNKTQVKKIANKLDEFSCFSFSFPLTHD